MRTKELGIMHPFCLSQFFHPKVWVSVEVAENDDEAAAMTALFEKARHMEQAYRQFIGETAEVDRNPPVPVVQAEKDEKDVFYSLEEEIKNCTDLSNLKSCEFLIRLEKDSDRKRRLFLLYDEQLATLSTESR